MPQNYALRNACTFLCSNTVLFSDASILFILRLFIGWKITYLVSFALSANLLHFNQKEGFFKRLFTLLSNDDFIITVSSAYMTTAKLFVVVVVSLIYTTKLRHPTSNPMGIHILLLICMQNYFQISYTGSNV